MVSKLKASYTWWVRNLGNSFGFDAGYFIKGGVAGGIQQVIGLASGLGLAYMFGHFTSRSVFGEYNLILSIIGLVAIVSIPGLNLALLQSAGRGFDSSLWRAVQKRWLWSLIGVPLLLAVAIYYQKQGSDVLPAILVVSAGFFPWLQATQTVSSFFLAKKKFGVSAGFTGWSSIMTLVLVSAAILFSGKLVWILAGYFLGLMIPATAGLVYATKKLVRWGSREDKELLPYGYFLTGVQILPTAASQLANILLAKFLGVETLAVFSVVGKFPGIVQTNFDVLFKPVTAKLAGQSKQEHIRVIKTHLMKFLIMGGVMFGGLWLMLPSLIGWFYGPNYSQAVGYSRLYAVFVLFLPLTWLLGDMVTFQKRKEAIVVLSTILPVVKLAAYFWVIPKWQITGLIWIILGERILTVVYSGIVLLRPAR